MTKKKNSQKNKTKQEQKIFNWKKLHKKYKRRKEIRQSQIKNFFNLGKNLGKISKSIESLQKTPFRYTLERAKKNAYKSFFKWKPSPNSLFTKLKREIGRYTLLNYIWEEIKKWIKENTPDEDKEDVGGGGGILDYGIESGIIYAIMGYNKPWENNEEEESEDITYSRNISEYLDENMEYEDSLEGMIEDCKNWIEFCKKQGWVLKKTNLEAWEDELFRIKGDKQN